jgi:hypothetical protein
MEMCDHIIEKVFENHKFFIYFIFRTIGDK